MLCSITKRWSFGGGRGGKGWDGDGAGDGDGNRVGSEDVDELETGWTGDVLFGARLDWAGLAGVGLGCPVCKRSSPIQAPGTGGEDFCQQVRQPVEGLGLWGKAGSEEEEEEPKEGRSGGQDILWELGGWGLGDASEVSQGPGTGAAERELEGAGCWSQFAEGIVGARKGKDVGAGFGETLQPGLRMLV